MQKPVAAPKNVSFDPSAKRSAAPAVPPIVAPNYNNAKTAILVLHMCHKTATNLQKFHRKYTNVTKNHQLFSKDASLH